MVDRDAMQAQLKVLSDAYAAQLPEKLKQLELKWNQFSQANWDKEDFLILHRLVHGMSGSGRTFGFSELSSAAFKLEEYLKQAGEKNTALNKEQHVQIERLLGELKQSASRSDKAPAEKFDWIAAFSGRSRVSVSRHVFVVEDDHELSDELQVQLSYFGYEVSVFNTLSKFRAAMKKNPNVVVLMDVNFPEDEFGGIHAAAELQQGRDVPVPVIFLSAHSEMNVRLESVRVGSVAYLTKPVNIGLLVDKLDELTSTQSQAAYRVLIVDDAAHLTDYYAMVLEQAGMLVKVVNDPLEVLRPLSEFTPDLILIDMYMPGCNGMELASVIRQLDEFVSIPIVFLSAEKDLDKQLSAINLGGDDFLTKPIEAHHLVSSVTSRIKRSLLLRSFMVRDSLTGLLNHTAIKSQLSHEMARAKRQGLPLAFAMIDIDNFKLINDKYGHPVGDRVIKSLSRLLKQRLRENDVVGRYGGEEFAVVLVDADSRVAMKILDTIRNDFAQLRHLADDHEFFSAFSCGIADNEKFSDASRLTDAADKALYKAKHAGRNQTMIADV